MLELEKGGGMKRNRFSIDQIIRILTEAKTPSNFVVSVARKYGIVEQAKCRFRQKYKGFPLLKPNVRLVKEH